MNDLLFTYFDNKLGRYNSQAQGYIEEYRRSYKNTGDKGKQIFIDYLTHILVRRGVTPVMEEYDECHGEAILL